MTYKDALIEVLKQNGIEILENNFMVHSLLLDKIGKSFIDLELANALYTLNENKGVYILFSSKRPAKNIDAFINQYNNDEKIDTYYSSLEPIITYLNIKYKRIVNNNVPNKVSTSVSIKKEQAKYSELMLDIRCKNLTVSFTDDTKYKVMRGGIDSTNKVKTSMKGNELKIQIIDDSHKYQISLPKIHYDKVSLYHLGKSLVVFQGDDKDTLIDKLSVFAMSNRSLFSVNSNELKIEQTKGKLFFSGTAQKIDIIEKKSEKHFGMNIKSKYRPNVFVSFGRRYIESNLLRKIRGQLIQRGLSRTKAVNGTYKVNRRKVSLDVSLKHGYIKF